MAESSLQGQTWSGPSSWRPTCDPQHGPRPGRSHVLQQLWVLLLPQAPTPQGALSSATLLDGKQISTQETQEGPATPRAQGAFARGSA
eukprot:16443993-Heterocapsa_arctica.AAC.1